MSNKSILRQIILLILSLFIFLGAPATVSAVTSGDTGQKGYNFYYSALNYSDLEPYKNKMVFEGLDTNGISVYCSIESYGANKLAVVIEKKSIYNGYYLDYGTVSVVYNADGTSTPLTNDFNITDVTIKSIYINEIFQKAFQSDERDVGYKSVFDDSNIISDLIGSGVNLSDYPENDKLSLRFINFVEYGYTSTESRKGNFGLYVYIYNPQRIEINTTSFTNRVQLAVGYDTDKITRDSKPTGYDTFNIRYCSKAEGGLYYKFRIVDHIGADDKTIEERVDAGERRYDVSGIVLNDKEYEIGGTFCFSGYGKGYHTDILAESTLKNSMFSSLETIRLEVTPTTYRTDSSSLGKNHQNAINSVYFSVPNEYLTDKDGNLTGNLQKIRAEWYEYKTQPIIILEHQEYVNEFKPYIGVNIGDGTDDISKEYWIRGDGVLMGNRSYFYEPSYNISSLSKSARNPITTLYYVFQSNKNTGKVHSSDLEEYIRAYTKTANKGYLPVEDGQISADLFLDTVDEGRTRGYNNIEVDANHKFNILSYDETHSGWDKFWDFFFNAPTTDDTRKNINPIYQMTASDLALSDSSFSYNMLVDDDDVKNIKSMGLEAKANGETPFLFRFAQTDYYSAQLLSSHHSQIDLTPDDDCADWLAQETVFLDFKIIHLTFNVDDELRTVPVVSDPIDIIPELTPPVYMTDGGNTFLQVLFSILTAVLSIFIIILEIKILIKMFKSKKTWVKVVAIILLIAFIVVDFLAIRWAITYIQNFSGF